MDPWLERPMAFPTLHNTLVTHLQSALKPLLPRGYIALSANRVWVDVQARREPDVGVFGPPDAAAAPGGMLLAAGPGLLALAAEPLADPVEEPYLEIQSAEDDRLVTAIEVVSLSNKKPGEAGRTSYRQKQAEFRAGGVNLIEIDLLRAGPHVTSVSLAELRAAGAFDYHVCVSPADTPGRCVVAAFRLADRLPTIPVPLDPGLSPVALDLQAVFDRCYDDGPFAELARYARRDPDPPLAPEQRAWADALLREKGLLPPAGGPP
jgi:hypothetical protein